MRLLRWWRQPLWNPPDKLTLGWCPFKWIVQDTRKLYVGDLTRSAMAYSCLLDLVSKAKLSK